METSTTLLQYRLREKIKTLKQERDKLGDELTVRLAGIEAAIAHPAPYIKALLADLVSDKEVQRDLLKTGVHLTADYLIDKYLPKERDAFLAGLLSNLRKRAGGAPGFLWGFLARLIQR